MPERRQEDFDRDFTEMVSGLDMAPFGPPPATDLAAEPADLREPQEHHRPLSPARDPLNLAEAIDRAEVEEPAPSEYLPPPLPPLQAPRGVQAVGWACAGYVLIALVLTIVGVRLPAWAGWVAIVAFVAALIIGWRSLPRDRDPGDGDGAVV